MSTYKMLFKLLTPNERKQIPIILLVIFIGMLFETVGISLVIPAIALMTQTNLPDMHPAFRSIFIALGSPTQVELVRDGMLVLFGFYVVKTLFLMFMSWKQNKFIFSIQASLSHRLFTGYLKQPWSFHLQHNSAQLIRNLTIEVNMFANTALQSGMGLITEGFVLTGIIVFLVIIEPLGTLVVMSILLLAAWSFQKVTKHYLLSLGQARQHHEGMRIQHLQQGLGGVKDVKILGREQDFLAQYTPHNKGNSHASRMQQTLLQLPRFWIELLAVGGLVALVLVLLAQRVLPNELLPVLGLFAAAAFRVAPSANRILGTLQNLHY